MAYARTTWVDNVTAVSAANMNNIETELVALDARVTVPAVVNGQWVKGVGGAAVWSAITPADISGYPADATKYLRGDGTWAGVTPTSVVNPMAKIAANAIQSIPNSTGQPMVLPVVGYDTDGMTTVANKITIQHAGRYLIVVYGAFALSTSGALRQVWPQVNGVPVVDGKISMPFATASQTPRGCGVTILNLNAGDVVEGLIFHDSGAALNTSYIAGGDVCSLEVTKIDGALVSYVGVPGSLVGQELAYAQITALVTVTATVEAAGTPVVTAPAFTVDGATPVLVEFFAPYGQTASGANTTVTVCLFEGATEIGRIFVMRSTSASDFDTAIIGRIRLTPSAGSHTYSVTAFQAGGNGIVGADVGGTAKYVPAHLRITRAA